jgi:sialic acid synthase SpsE
MEWIAEISSNHNGDLTRALKFIDVAKKIGATAVKFQLFKLDELYTPEALVARPKLAERRAWELPLSFVPILAEHAHELGLKFGCTPFYMDAIGELYPHVDFYKIASYQVPWLDLIGKIATRNKPIVMSVGMADEREIARAVATVCANRNDQLTLLHCVSHYPALPGECNLATIDYLRDSFGVAVGWSDHSVDPAVLYQVASMPAVTTIEFHLDIDGKGNEYHIGHCWKPTAIAKVIKLTSEPNAEVCDAVVYGTYNIVTRDSELQERLWRSDPSDGKRPMQILRDRNLDIS